MLHRSHKRAIRYELLFANLVLLLAVVGFVVNNPSEQAATHSLSGDASNTVAASPLDQLSSADIAVHIARMTSLPESTAVTNQADTVNGQQTIVSADDQVVAKPQVVATALKSRKDIQTYTTEAGDTLATIAAKFGVTSDSIKWSNDLSNPNIQPGTALIIPPVNGIVYTVKPGDTPDKLAGEFNASRDNLIAFNDAEVGGLPVGQRIVIPDGTKAVALNVTRTAPAFRGGGNFAWGSSAVYGHNGYDYGWCTWYAASKVAVPANWGNANTWDNYAARSGWTVSSVPRPGAVAQTDGMGGLGHVGVVEAVSEDGTMIKYSDMNGLAGWGRAGYSDWVPVHQPFQKFIYR